MVETWWSFQTREKSLDRWKIEFQKASTDGRTTTTNSRLHRRDVLVRSGTFGDLRWGEDIDLWTRIGFVGPIRRVKIPTTAHAYTRGGDNLTFEFCPDIGAQYHGVRSLPPTPPPPPEPEPPPYRIIKPPLDVDLGGALNVKAGVKVSGVIPGEFVAAGEIARFGVQIGTYVGHSTGDLVVELSVGGRSASGVASVDGAGDNLTLMVPLQTPLAVSAGETVSYLITHPNGNDVAIWLSPTRNLALQTLPYALSKGQAARWTIEYKSDMPEDPLPSTALVPVPAKRPPINPRQFAKRVAKRVIPAPIKRNQTIRRAASWAIDKLRPRP